MKASSVFLWPCSIALAAAHVVPEGGNGAELQRSREHFGQHGFPGEDCTGPNCDSSPRQGLGMTFWNDFSQPITEDIACKAFRSLEWLAFNLIQPTEEITSEAGTRVFVPKHQQTGPLVLNLRAMTIWTKVLNEFAVQLAATNVWSLAAQLHVAQCYLDYSFQTAAWLTVLRTQSCDFNSADPASCLVYDKIEALYIAYTHVANLLYGKNTGVPAKVQELITGQFPEQLPPGWRTRFHAPRSRENIRDYIARYDLPLPESGKLFQRNQEAWACTDAPGGIRPFCNPT